MKFDQREVFQQQAHPSRGTFYDLKKKGGKAKAKSKASSKAKASQHLSNVIKINIGRRVDEEVQDARRGQASSFSQFRLAPPSIHFAAPPAVMRNDAYAVPNNLSTNVLERKGIEHTPLPMSYEQKDPANPRKIEPVPARKTLTPMYGVSSSPLVHIRENVPDMWITQPSQKPTGRGNIPEPKAAQASSTALGSFFPLRGQRPKTREEEFQQEQHADRHPFKLPSQREVSSMASAVSSFGRTRPPGSIFGPQAPPPAQYEDVSEEEEEYHMGQAGTYKYPKK